MPTRLHPYLSFAGNCAEAFAFYNHAIANGAATIEIRKHSSAPAEFQQDPAAADQVLFAQFHFEDLTLLASDIPPAHRVAPNRWSTYRSTSKTKPAPNKSSTP